jgi:hypothetical protein
LDDDDFDALSHLGEDHIEYRIPLHGKKGYANLDVKLRYHTFPARWMNDLFAHDTIAEVEKFKSMYAGYEIRDEVIAHSQVNDILLSTTSLQSPLNESNLVLFPNPGSSIVNLQFPGKYSEIYTYALVNTNGIVFQKGTVKPSIQLKENLSAGLYYFTFYKNGQYQFSIPYTHL